MSTHDLPELLKKSKKIEKVADALIKGDPEIDIEQFGMALTDTSRVYITKTGIVHLVEEFEVITNPDGTVPRTAASKETSAESERRVPIRWSGKFIKKEEALKKFVLTNKKQLVHVNGLTYDFLYDMAKELEKKKSLMFIRAVRRVTSRSS
jgi:hypothetical protein